MNESARTTKGHRRAALLDGQRKILAGIASAAPLSQTLEAIVRLVEEQADGMLCAILMVDPDGKRLRFAMAPDVPDDYKQGIEPHLQIAPFMGACGTAAFRRQPVYTRDAGSDPLWENCGDIAIRNGLHAIWSTPFFSSDGAVLGTFAMYYNQPRLPSNDHIRLIDMATQMARAAIEPRQGPASAVSEATQKLLAQLSDRERQVLEHVVAGQTSKQIGARLHIAAASVDTYRSRIMVKLGVRNLADLVRVAVQHGVTGP